MLFNIFFNLILLFRLTNLIQGFRQKMNGQSLIVELENYGDLSIHVFEIMEAI